MCFVLWYQGSEKNVEAFKWEIKGNFNRKLLMCFGQDVLLGRILFPSVSCMVFFGGKGQELFNWRGFAFLQSGKQGNCLWRAKQWVIVGMLRKDLLPAGRRWGDLLQQRNSCSRSSLWRKKEVWSSLQTQLTCLCDKSLPGWVTRWEPNPEPLDPKWGSRAVLS